MAVILILAALVALGWWAWEKSHRKTHPVPPGLQVGVTLPHEQEFELYHNALSLCSMKARFCMAELRIPYRSHPIDLIETGRYETLGRDFLKVNPGGTVPVLVHEGHPVYESHEQIRYAADHAPPGCPSLVPDDPALREQMQRWVDRSSITEDPLNHGDLSAGNAVPGLTLPIFAAMIEKIPVHEILVGLLFHWDRVRPLLFLALKLRGIEGFGSIRPLADAVARSRRQMEVHMDALEEQLQQSEGPWILGNPFCLADVGWFAIFERLEQLDTLEAVVGGGRRPACAAYWEALKKRPSYQEAIVEHAHPLVAYGTRRIREAKEKNAALRAVLEGAPPA